MAELLSYAETQKLLDDLPREQQKLVSDLVPALITVGGVQRVLQSLLSERVSVRDLPTILEGIHEACGGTLRGIPAIVAHVRARLARQISDSQTGPSGYIPLVTLVAGVGGGVRRSAGRPAGGPAAGDGAEQAAGVHAASAGHVRCGGGAGRHAGAADQRRHSLPRARDRGAHPARARRCWRRRRSSPAPGSARWGRYEPRTGHWRSACGLLRLPLREGEGEEGRSVPGLRRLRHDRPPAVPLPQGEAAVRHSNAGCRLRPRHAPDAPEALPRPGDGGGHGAAAGRAGERRADPGDPPRGGRGGDHRRR